ncbi:hypothetical protein FRC08_006106 [Ceratobasidium sp. 394]|nr:hypothetical protein FRC08_006106 [Ceratobasidium sp. 394]
MNSLLAIALAAQVVSANPIIGRQVATSGTHSRNATAAPTSTVHQSTVVISDSETSGFPTTTVEFPTSYATPTPTSRGGSHGSYWYCYFPGTQNAPTGTYTSLEPTFTDTFSFPEPTDSTTGPFTDTFTETDTGFISTVTPTAIATTDILTETEAETDTLSVDPEPTDTDTVTPTSIDFTVTDLPTPTDTIDLPITTAPSPTGGPGGVHTYTIIGPASATQVIECIRVPRWGGHPHPHPQPPHHTSFVPTSTFVPTWTASAPIPTDTDA